MKLLSKRIVGIGVLRQQNEDYFKLYLTKEGARVWDTGFDGFISIKQELYTATDGLPMKTIRRVVVVFGFKVVNAIDLFESGKTGNASKVKK